MNISCRVIKKARKPYDFELVGRLCALLVLLATIACISSCSSGRNFALALPEEMIGHVKIGMTQNEVIRLIGPATKVNLTRENGAAAEVWTYSNESIHYFVREQQGLSPSEAKRDLKNHLDIYWPMQVATTLIFKDKVLQRASHIDG